MSQLFDAFVQLFSDDGFVPRRVCGLWPDWLVYEHIAGNALIWLAYMAVPILIWRLGRRRVEWARFAGLIRAFAAFIALCGVGHFFDMLAFFRPMYRFSGHVLIATGAASWWTVWSLWRYWPSIVALKSPAELERVIAERTAELRRAVDELKRTEADRARLAAIVESTDDAIIGQDLDDVITSWNAGAERLFGYPAAEALGRPVVLLVPPDRRTEERALLAKVRGGGCMSNFESVRLTKDGRTIDVSLTVSPIRDASGATVGVSKIARDVTPRKLADRALRESESRFRQLADAMPQIVWTSRADGFVDYYNDRWYAFTGRSRGEAGDESWMPVIHPDDLGRCQEAWARAVATGEPYQVEYRFRSRDGGYRWHLGRALPARDDAGRITRWYGTGTDIHDERLQADALRESEERQRRALSAARLAHWEWDTDSDAVTTHGGHETLFGRPEGATFTSCREFLGAVHPDDRPDLAENLARCVSDGSPYDAEFRVVWPDGSVRWLAAKGGTFRDADGRVVRMAGVNVDVTEKKRNEEQIRFLYENLEQKVEERTTELAGAMVALRESERRFRAIFDSTFQFMGLLSPAGTLLEANQTALDFAGVTRGDVLGRPAWETHWWSHSEEARDRLRAAVAEAAAGRFVRYEEDHVGTDGEVVTVDFSLKPVRDESGAVTLLIPEGRQINELKRAAESLRLSEARFRGAFDASAIGMALVAPDGRWLQVNRSLCEIVGYPEGELLGMTFQEITHPDDLEADLGLLRKVLAGEIASYQMEKRYRHKAGQVVWVVLSVSLVRDADGRPLHLVSQIEDVTDRKKSEEDLLRARDEAMAATRAKGDFLANMSHEIRTPMNGVIGMTDLLLDTRLNPIQRDYAETIRGSGEALLTVINDILDFSKIEAGKLTLESTDFDLRTVIEEVADLLAPRVHQKGLEINSRVDPRIPARLKGDPVRVRQVLTNLAGNAVKFTDRGEVNLEAALVADEDGRATVRVSVRDTGIGIPADRQADVFESFTQIEGGNNRRHGGTGLGLAICRNLVGLMGGEIGLESAPGAGSTFWFEITLGKASGGPDDPLADVAGLRVLVVDDHETNRSIAREALLSWGCRPDVVSSGEEASARLAAAPDDDPFGLVLLDHLMPGADGVETARRMKDTPRFAGVPIVLLTSVGSPGAAGDVEEGLFAAVLSKPLRRSQLYNAVCRAVARFAGGRAPGSASESGEGEPPLGLRLLLAEDNEVNRRVAIGMAERLGCRVIAVENGRAALDAVTDGRFDLVLMDVQMPEMDGLAATAAIRERERATGRRVPIVAMTAHAMQGDREKCLAAGMDGYLTKPLRPAFLREALLEWTPADRPLPNEPDPPPPPAGPAWLADALRESCGDDRALVSEVLGLMLKGTPGRIERLGAAVEAADARKVSWEAHALKGVFLTVGAEGLASACQDLMRLGELGDFRSIAAAYPGVRDQWDRLKAEAARCLVDIGAVAPAT